MNIKERIEKRFNKKMLNFQRLLEMVEQQMDGLVVENEAEEGENIDTEGSGESEKLNFSGAKFYKTAMNSFKAPTEQSGKMGTDERQNFQKYITRNIRGKTLAEKIDSINTIVNGEPDSGAKISEIMGALGALKMLQETLDDFNPSTAGFLFEAFLSGLLQGEQVTDTVGGTLPIEDCWFFIDPKTGDPGQPVSLKLLKHSVTIDGSLDNLLGFFMKPEIAAVAEEKGIEYIVATKTRKNKLDLYSFNIRPSNFFFWIEERYFDFSSLASENIELREHLESPEVLEANKQRWENAFLRSRAPMFGLNPSEVEFNYDWKNEGQWKSVVKRPSYSRAGAPQTAEIMLSPAGKKSFASWAKADFGMPPNLEELVISSELEAEFFSEDEQVSSHASVEIAKIGAIKRLSAYYRSIEALSYEVHEAPQHIQRWYGANKSGDQYVESDVVRYLNDMVQDGSAESVIKWAQTLESIRLKTQFEIRPVSVRTYSTIYGTIDPNRRKILRTLQKYSSTLAKSCAPIYEELERFTRYINGYYMQNRTGDAFKASESAEQLSEHAKELTSEVEK